MAAPRYLTSRLDRLFIRLLRRKGSSEVQALAQWIQLQGLFRFLAVFALTIMIPAVALAYFGWSSIRAEELSVRAEARNEARDAVETLRAQFATRFDDLERKIRQRLQSGRSPLDSPLELSSQVLVVLRLEQDGRIAAPFSPPSEELAWEQQYYLSGSWTEARRLESLDPAQASLLYAKALQEARGHSSRAAASLGQARALSLQEGKREEAMVLLEEIQRRFPDTRSIQGFLSRDLASLQLGQLMIAQDPERARVHLQDLFEELLGRRWVIGRGAEMALAARSLELLEEISPRDWLTKARGRLEQQGRQLFWAEQLLEELSLLEPPSASSDGQTLDYQAGEEALWVQSTWLGERYVVALSKEGLLRDFINLSGQHSTRFENLAVEISPSRDVSDDALAKETLSPWLEGWTLSAQARDSDALQALQARKKAQRVFFILISVLSMAAGAGMSVRLIRRELGVARMKATFAANVSHELRSPITQIRLKGESLLLGLVDGEQDMQQHYESIVRESERLTRLVENILDFSALERGARRYTFQAGDLGETVRSAVEIASRSMEVRSMDIQMSIPPGLPPVHQDPEAVRQVILNLVSNAAKYGRDAGWIRIAMEAQGEVVTVSVTDGGIGIAPEEQARIFEEYYRSKDASARKQKGTGIGLTIVRYIMDAHQGRVSLQSEPGKGSCFTLYFPSWDPEEEIAHGPHTNR